MMLNVAIVGTGNISHNHIQGYLQFGQRCRIVALVDIYPEKAEEKGATAYQITEARSGDTWHATAELYK